MSKHLSAVAMVALLLAGLGVLAIASATREVSWAPARSSFQGSLSESAGRGGGEISPSSTRSDPAP